MEAIGSLRDQYDVFRDPDSGAGLLLRIIKRPDPEE